jgi:hypothetical protein
MNHPTVRLLFRSSLIVLAAALSGAVDLRAQLKAEPASLDLGRQKQEQVARGEVKLINTGTEAVDITEVTADCSCTAGDPDKKTLAPGESTRLAISVETRSYDGELKRRVHVETTKGSVTIPVTAQVTPYTHWSFAPSPVVMPASLKGREVSSEVTLTYTGTEPVEIKGWKATPALVKATVASQQGNVYKIKITKSADVMAGNHSFRLEAETTDKVDPLVAVNGFLPVNSTIQVSPNPIILPVTKPGQRSVLPVRLTGWEAEASPHLYVKNGDAKVVARDGKDCALEIGVTPAVPGSFTEMLQIFAGDRLELEIPILVRAE